MQNPNLPARGLRKSLSMTKKENEIMLKSSIQTHALAIGVATLATGSILAVAGHMHYSLFGADAANDARIDAHISCSPLANTMQGIAGKVTDSCIRIG
jgi:hypothetical protein